MDYQWDVAKAKSNKEKHGIDFADAVTALDDDNALTMPDDDPDEDRFVTIGLDALGRVLVVIYTYRSSAMIRIISARKATPRERKQY
ncbi:MAG TPA: BrnT family toxin, partial [Anaerolineales bacterium]|nr:BrnT family toxin [Anaerolineales bacterium]